MMSDLPLDQVRTLLAAVDEGTFDAAARALRVTPSAVSQRVKALEQRIGRVLLSRSKPIQLTESGEVIARFARQLARLERDASAELGLPETGEPARLTIAVGSDPLATWLIPALASATPRLPMSLEVLREDENYTTHLLHQGLVMAAISSRAEPVRGCTVHWLGRMRYFAMASPAFVEQWLSGGPLDQTLADAPMIAFDRKDELQDRFLRAIAPHRPTPRTRHYVPANDAIRLAVSNGIGWGMIPRSQASEDRASGALVDLAEQLPIDVPLYWHQWKLDSPALAALAESISAVAANALQ